MPDIRFPVTSAGHIPVVVTPPEVDVTNVEGLRTALLEAAQRHPTLVVDMSQTQFCDSTGIQALVRARNRARENEGEVLLVLAHPAVHRILTLTGIGRMFESFVTLQDALAHAANGHRQAPGKVDEPA